MKLYLCCDIEGIATLSSFDEARATSAEYTNMALQMSSEVIAACKGALNANVSEIYVEDCHGNGRNLIPSKFPKEVKLIRGVTHDVFGLTSVFDKSFDAIAFIGYHDCAGSNGNPTSHTMVGSTINKITVNDKLFSEFHMHAYAAANLGVPTIFLSGDLEICNKAKSEINNIYTVATKEGRGNSVISISPELSCQLIEDKMTKSVNNYSKINRIILPDSFKVQVTYNKHYDAYKNSHYPNAKQISPCTVEFNANDYGEVMRFFYFVI